MFAAPLFQAHHGETCACAAHNLELARIACWNFCSLRKRWLLRVLENQKEEIAMALALEVSFALWIMIGCATENVVQFVGYLN
jgi:hypothetical protein